MHAGIDCNSVKVISTEHRAVLPELSGLVFDTNKSFLMSDKTRHEDVAFCFGSFGLFPVLLLFSEML